MLQENIQKKRNLNEIIVILNEINKDIIHLHRYAAEDFTLMRSVFRENNYKAEKLEKNTKKAFEMIGTSRESETLIQKMEEYFISISDCYHYMRTKTGLVTDYVNELHRNLEQMIIPVKNLNQHIVSLKLVLANIKIYPSFGTQSKTQHNDLDLMCDRIRNIYISLSDGIESMDNLLECIKKDIGLVEKFHMEQLHEFLNKIDKCKVQFLKKHQEAVTQIPELSAKIIDNIGNSHKIIVELQYHDIIRQKIEHVQETHNQIIQQLTQFQNNNNREANDEISKYLLHVGDIVRIQASQLLQANKEYESAIDTISEELLSFSDNMTGITNLCKKLSLTNTNIPHCGIEDTINTNAELRIKMTEANKLLDEHCLAIKNELASVVEYFTDINVCVGRLNSSLHNIDSKGQDFEESRKISYTQINELVKDLTSTVSYLKELFDNISDLNNRQFIELTKNDTRNEFNRKMEIMLEHEQRFLPEFNQDNETISAIFEENTSYTRNLADNILAAIRSIKYYDFFDKLADKIIQRLNYISETYNIQDSVADIYDVEFFKQKYTMNSERRIHDNALGHGKSNVELFNECDESVGQGKSELF